MKYLSIRKGKGYFLSDDEHSVEIDRITKEDILRLIDYATEPENEFEMDDYQGNIELANEAHKVIYSNLYKKFNELLDSKDRFRDESKSVYKDALDKYCRD